MIFPKTHPKIKNSIKVFVVNSKLILLLSNTVVAEIIKPVGIPTNKIPRKELINIFLSSGFLVLPF
jgi:hypothetical protein